MMLLILAIAIPLFGSALCLVLKPRAREACAIALVAISFILTVLLIPTVMNGQTYWISLLNADFFSVSFELDKIGLVFALMFSLLGLVALIYSVNYIKENANEYYFITTLLIGSLMGVAYSNNLILLYVFWEIAAFCTWRLIGFTRKAANIKIADKSFMMTLLGSSLMLLGFVFIYLQKGTLDLDLLRGQTLDSPELIFNLIFLGLIAKSVCLPIYTWLQDAHPVAPSPSSALLSGIITKIGVLAFAKIWVSTFNYTAQWVIPLAIISSIIAGGAALVSSDMKKIIAYSTISQIAYILFGFALLNEFSTNAALLYAFAHALGKGGLFLGAGVVEKYFNTRDIRKLGGFIKVSPITGIGFLFCAASIAGIPPFGGFWAKLMIIMGLLTAGHIWIAVLAIFSAMLTLFYMWRLFDAVFVGDLKQKFDITLSKTMVACVLILGILSLLIGLFVSKFLLLVK
ncbi:MAG: proton-conducting transporter membrane subunit [bacterium]|nr:proton-conducting transporter membrane subunit [bacterium]